MKGSEPVVTPTANPLVALFSAPPCPEGSQFRVVFQRKGATDASRTPLQPCNAVHSGNLYVAGMRENSEYEMNAETVTSGEVKAGLAAAFRTGMAAGMFPQARVAVPVSDACSRSERLLIHSMEEPTRTMATDLDGHVVWYLGVHEASMTRMLAGGHFLVFSGSGNETAISRNQVLDEVDLAGNVLRATNMARVAEQLEPYGIKSVCKPNGHECASGFHHEAIRLPNDHTLVVAGLERMFPEGGQGSKDPVDIIGDLIVDLDADFQVAWVWKAFDHLDIKRAGRAVEEKCRGTGGGGGCPAVFLAPSANDWLHTNSLNYSPHDGNLLLSSPHQDWIMKIDYLDGKGTGKVLWRLGNDGDLRAKSKDDHPWFSYQHDARLDPADSGTLLLLDNGPDRRKKDPQAHTRGQMWKVDEKSHTAELVMNMDLGVYSPFVGSAQRLDNGNFHFLAGAMFVGDVFSSRSIEISPSGKVLYALETDGTITYRSNRIVDLYTPPGK